MPLVHEPAKTGSPVPSCPTAWKILKWNFHQYVQEIMWSEIRFPEFFFRGWRWCGWLKYCVWGPVRWWGCQAPVRAALRSGGLYTSLVLDPGWPWSGVCISEGLDKTVMEHGRWKGDSQTKSSFLWFSITIHAFFFLSFPLEFIFRYILQTYNSIRLDQSLYQWSRSSPVLIFFLVSLGCSCSLLILWLQARPSKRLYYQLFLIQTV